MWSLSFFLKEKSRRPQKGEKGWCQHTGLFNTHEQSKAHTRTHMWCFTFSLSLSLILSLFLFLIKPGDAMYSSIRETTPQTTGKTRHDNNAQEEEEVNYATVHFQHKTSSRYCWWWGSLLMQYQCFLANCRLAPLEKDQCCCNALAFLGTWCIRDFLHWNNILTPESSCCYK